MAEVTPTPSTAPLANDGRQEGSPPELPFLHMWRDGDDHSRLNAAMMGGFALKSVGGGADPQWMRPFPGTVSAVTFAILPVGWVGEWHETPKPQWVIPIRGRWFLETQDGARVEMGPGDIHWGHEGGTQAIDGRKGHLSGTVGDEACHQLIVQFADDPVPQAADPLR